MQDKSSNLTFYVLKAAFLAEIHFDMNISLPLKDPSTHSSCVILRTRRTPRATYRSGNKLSSMQTGSSPPSMQRCQMSNGDCGILVNSVERHTRCSAAYCLRYNPELPEPYCRFGYPKSDVFIELEKATSRQH